MRKLLILAIALVLVLGLSTLTLAQQTQEPVQFDVGVCLMQSHLTVRGDYEFAYFKLPMVKHFPDFSIGVKTPPLIFDLYGIGGVQFSRQDAWDDNLLSDWELASNHRFSFGVGKTVQLDELKLRLEGLTYFDEDLETDYGVELTFSYTFDFGGD